MALASAQVIDAIATLLRGVGGWSGRVYTSRAWPFAEADLPAWRVIAADEAVEVLGVKFPAQQRHDLTVLCQGHARATADLDDTLHALAASALAALFASESAARLSPLRCSMSLTSVERELIEEGEAALGRVTLALLVRFLTFNNAPETIL